MVRRTGGAGRDGRSETSAREPITARPWTVFLALLAAYAAWVYSDPPAGGPMGPLCLFLSGVLIGNGFHGTLAREEGPDSPGARLERFVRLWLSIGAGALLLSGLLMGVVPEIVSYLAGGDTG